MAHLLLPTKTYLREALGLQVVLSPWAGAQTLPPFLRDTYGFHEGVLLGHRLLFIFDTAADEISAARLSKQLAQVEAKAGASVVYVRERMTPINRRRLIEHKVSFIVPSSQLYLPMLGMDLREHVRRLRQKPEQLGVVAQMLVLDLLLGEPAAVRTPTLLAARLGYSKMTIGRAFDELEAAGVGEVRRQGRERLLDRADDVQAFWAQVWPWLSSPVKERHFVKAAALGAAAGHPVAGEAALARHTMLAAPPWPVVALDRTAWQLARNAPGFEEYPEGGTGITEVEVWTYPPDLFARDGVVDSVSLWLSLAAIADERVEAALDTLLKGPPWSKDWPSFATTLRRTSTSTR